MLVYTAYYTVYIYMHTYIHVQYIQYSGSLCSCISHTINVLYLLPITLDRNEIWAQDLYHSTTLIEAAKSLVPSNVKGHGKIPYQKPRLKSVAHGIYPCIV